MSVSGRPSLILVLRELGVVLGLRQHFLDQFLIHHIIGAQKLPTLPLVNFLRVDQSLKPHVAK